MYYFECCAYACLCERVNIIVCMVTHVIGVCINVCVCVCSCVRACVCVSLFVFLSATVVSDTNHVDLEELIWHNRCMHVPELPNSIFTKEKTLRPRHPCTFQEKFHDRIVSGPCSPPHPTTTMCSLQCTRFSFSVFSTVENRGQ